MSIDARDTEADADATVGGPAAAEADPAEELAAFGAAAAVGMTASFWAARRGERPAILSPLGDRTWAELNANANRLVRALRARGLRRGRRRGADGRQPAAVRGGVGRHAAAPASG